MIKPKLKNPNQLKLILYSRISVLIVSIIALTLALTIPGLVNLMVTGKTMSVSGLLAPVIMGLYWKRPTEVAGITSMWVGLSSAVIWQVLAHPFDIHPIIIGLPLSIITLLVVSLLTKPINKLAQN